MNAQLDRASFVVRNLSLLALIAAPSAGQLVTVTPTTILCQGNYAGNGDFDGSGAADLLLVSFIAPAITVIRDPAGGNGTCTTTPIPGATLIPEQTTKPANLDGNAALDALLSLPYDNLILDAYGNGAGGFTFPGTGPYPVPPTSGQVYLVATADFDLDGRDDAVVMRIGIGTGSPMEVFLNRATGWILASSYTLPGSSNVGQFKTGDVDGDGLTDLVWIEEVNVGPNSQSHLRVARGAPPGPPVVDPASVPLPGSWMRIAAVADLDVDGLDDVIIGLPTYGPTPVIFGVPAPALGTITGIPGLTSGDFPMVADFDQDGLPDLLLAEYSAIRMLRGLGNRQFSLLPLPLASQLVPPGNSSGWVPCLGDLDADSDVDVLWLEHNSVWMGAMKIENRTIFGPGCPGTSSTPRLHAGLATPGNSLFAISVSLGAPASAAVLGVSIVSVAPSACGLGLSLAPQHLLLPNLSAGIVTTDATGAGAVFLPLPPLPILAGVTVFAQWAVVDAGGGFPFAGSQFALSAPHTIMIW